MGQSVPSNTVRFWSRLSVQERSEEAAEDSKLDDRNTPGSPSLGAAGGGMAQVRHRCGEVLPLNRA